MTLQLTLERVYPEKGIAVFFEKDLLNEYWHEQAQNESVIDGTYQELEDALYSVKGIRAPAYVRRPDATYERMSFDEYCERYGKGLNIDDEGLTFSFVHLTVEEPSDLEKYVAPIIAAERLIALDDDLAYEPLSPEERERKLHDLANAAQHVLNSSSVLETLEGYETFLGDLEDGHMPQLHELYTALSRKTTD